MFIYTALLELLMCGETEIAAAGIRMAISKLRRMEPSGSITGFEKQFNVNPNRKLLTVRFWTEVSCLEL